MYKPNDPNLASTAASDFIAKMKSNISSSRPRVSAGEYIGLSVDKNKERILSALDDPHEASKVANEFLRYSPAIDEPKFLGAGVESIAFRLGEGKVGKIRLRSSVTGFSVFTPPKKLKEILRPEVKKSFGKTSIEITKEAKMGGKADDLAAMDIRSKLRKRGYEWHDAAARNVGEVNGQVKVIDYGHIRKSTQYREVRDYGIKKGFTSQEVADLVRRRSRTTVALQHHDAIELRKVIDVAAVNRRQNALRMAQDAKQGVKAIMKSGATRDGAGLVSNFVIRAAKTL